jgi:type IX secretion system substrate protein
MKKQKPILLFITFILFLSFMQLNAQSWKVYNGSLLPDVTGSGGDSLDISDLSDNSPGPGIIKEIIDDPIISGNKLLKYLNPDGKQTFRHYFDSEYADSTFTIMARIKAENDPIYDREMDIRWDNANAGTRDELRIWAADSTIELEKADLKVKVDMDLYQWHTYRIVVNGDISSLYIDENAVAVVEGITTATSSSKYMKIGDGSGDAIGGYIDWCVLADDGAFSPTEGNLPPAELFVDGVVVGPVDKWLIYDGGILPDFTGSGGDSLDISNLADNSPGAGMVKEIMDDSDISGNKLLKYLHPDGKQTFRHYFDDEYADSTFTIIARIKAENDPIYDRAMDIRWDNANAGTRDELRIWAADSTIELEKADLKIKVDMDLYQWHTYRIVVNGDMSSLYIDENVVAVVEGVTSASSSSKYIKIGDGSGDAIGGYVDWCILNVAGAYAPEEGLPIPSELYVDGQPMPVVPKWLVYDGGILPEETGSGDDSLDISNLADNSPGTGMIKEIMDDPSIPGNKLLKYLHPDGKQTFRHYFDDEYSDSTFTIIARLKAENDPVYDRAMDIRWDNANAGTRDELRIWAADSTIELEKADLKVKVDMDLYQWHSYRIVVNGDMSSLYIDENVVAVVEGISTASTTSKYLKIGDGSGDAIGGYVDWLILNVAGAYAPEEGLPIPSELYVDGQSMPVVPKWLVYEGGVLPEETGSGGDSLDISNLADNSPGTGMVKEIMDDPDISGNKLLKYLHPDGKQTFRHYFDDEYADSSFTIIARIKAENDPVYDRVMDIRWDNANAGTRDELRIWAADSTIELEKADLKVKLDMDLYQWHTYRIVVDGDMSTLYMDENDVPIVQGITTSSTSSQYLKLGDGSGDAIGGYIDWCILDVSDAYVPGKGLPIPEGLFVDRGPEPIIPKWLVYDGGVLPEETGSGGDSLDISDLADNSPGAGMIKEIMDDPDISGNKLFKYLHPDGKQTFRHYFNDEFSDSSFTIMARLKAENDPTYDRAMDIRWDNANAGTRDELRIWAADSTIELEKADLKVKVNMDLYQWHTYRIVVEGDMSTLYIDEVLVPVVEGITTASTSNQYLKFGDGSGDAIGGYVDWFILDVFNASAPGEGLTIPAGLFVDEYIAPVEDKWLVYDGNILPAETGSGGDSLDISNLSSFSPLLGFVEEIIDDSEIPGNKIFKYLMPVGTGMYKYSFPDNFVSGNFTLVVRTKQAITDTLEFDRALDFQWRNSAGGARDELRIDAAAQTLKLEKSDVTENVSVNLYEFITYRIAVKGGDVKVYMNESVDPIITGTSGESTSDSYIKFGDAGSASNGGYVDWMIVNVFDAYAPGEGLPIPEELYVDSVKVGVDDLDSVIPTSYSMDQNYPNPFNPSTTIQFQLPEVSKVELKVYNILGQVVATLVNQEMNAGYHKINFDASKLASGLYVYRIQAGKYMNVKKMMLLK